MLVLVVTHAMMLVWGWLLHARYSARLAAWLDEVL